MRQLLSLFLAVHVAWGCSCASSGPLCGSIESASVVFRGTVIETNDPHDGFIKGGIWYRVAVEEIFKGLPLGTKEVIVDPASGTSCQSSYDVGREYLVMSFGKTLADQRAVAISVGGFGSVAGQRPPGLVVVTGGCSGTREVQYAEEDLAFARAYLAAPSPARIYGAVRSGVQSEYSFDHYPEMPGAQVTITGQGQRYARTTGAQGEFAVENVIPGEYTVQVSAPGFVMDQFPDDEYPFDSFSIRVPRNGCAALDMSLYAWGSVSGRVVDDRGRPVRGIVVEYRYADPRQAEATLFENEAETDRNGRYRFPKMPVGSFLIGVHADSAPDTDSPYAPVYWGDGQTALQVSSGADRSGIDIRLAPKLKARRVKVQTFWSDGTPVTDGIIYADWGDQFAESKKLDRRGEATLPLLQDLSYSLSALGRSSYRTGPTGVKVPEQSARSQDVLLPAGRDDIKLRIIVPKPERE